MIDERGDSVSWALVGGRGGGEEQEEFKLQGLGMSERGLGAVPLRVV
jgi:hypothetical protein